MSCTRHLLKETRCNDCHAVWDHRPNKTEGHTWFCDCGSCLGDGNEAQWHRMGQPHPNCPQREGHWWPADHAPWWTCGGWDCPDHVGYTRDAQPAPVGPPPWIGIGAR